MTITRKLSLLLAAGASALALTACGGGGDNADSDLVVLHRGNVAEPLTLDPHKASGTWENNIIGDMFIGLFTENAAAEPVPGMATVGIKKWPFGLIPGMAWSGQSWRA